MIAVFLRDMTPRLMLVLLIGIVFYFIEPGFHQHEADVIDPSLGPDLSVLGISATLANLAGLSVLILLAGFISGDRRHGYTRLYFSHPTSPLAFYGLRCAVAIALALAAAAVFLVVGQMAAWGEVRGGWSGLLLALLSALMYAGLIAFLSAALPRGDAWVAVVLFFVTFFWLQLLQLGAPIPPLLRDTLTLVLPPQTAMQDVYDGLLRGVVDWGAAAFVLGYAAFWMVLAGVVVRWREWP